MSNPSVNPPVASGIKKGQVLFTRECPLTRAHLIAYAAASGDHNPIHWNDVFAKEVGLEGVIAHGMLTLGLAASAVSDWVGDPAAVTALETRFTRQVLVPNPGEELVIVVGKAGLIGEDEDGRTPVRVDLTVTGPEGNTVLAKSRATVLLPTGA